jgi:hypothetical protein
MDILVLAKQIVVSALLAYISFGNALADTILAVLSPHNVEVTEKTLDATESSDSSEHLPILSGNKAFGPISRLLLDHRDYQRAATYASRQTEDTTTPTSGSLDTLIRDALVNIYCQYKTKDFIRTTTGTGIIINKKGIILTNAHVAQFLLLNDSTRTGEVSCVIRQGDPAVAKYEAELLYISPTWIVENAQVITEESPRGTGERDYALLYIARSLDATPLPTGFPFIGTDTNLLSRAALHSAVLSAGYPAENLLRNGADAALSPQTATTTVQAMYTFGSNYADIFALSGSPVGEQGASGGPVMDLNSRSMIGLIATKGDEQLEGARSLRAITLSYIDRTITEETGFSLTQNMLGDTAYRGSVFKQIMTPFLSGILEEEIIRNSEE